MLSFYNYREEKMQTYSFLFEIAIILIFTKGFGLLVKKFNFPQVVGALLGGIILGPALLNIVKETEFINQVSEIGVILLMFIAGMETDIRGLKRAGKPSIVIASLGVITPLVGGGLLGYLYGPTSGNLMQSIFIGIILSATSVSITIETLREMGKLGTRVSDSLLGAAIIDDIIGIVLLAFVSSMSGSPEANNEPIYMVFLKIFMFFVVAGISWILFSKLFDKWFSKTEKGMRRYSVSAMALCLILSYVAERYFGVANIIGAFLAGLIFSSNTKNSYIFEHCETLSYMFFAPVFFASMGLKVELSTMDSAMIWFTIILTIIAIATKFIGCGLGAKLCKFSNKESIEVGCGMISRGEVALIVASKGVAMGVASQSLLPAIIIAVIATTLLTPIFLEFAFK